MSVSSHDFDRFTRLVGTRLGLAVDGTRATHAEEVLVERARRCGGTVASYVAALERGASADEWAALAQGLTVRETYFFRHRDQFDALCEVALPARAERRIAGGALRILSAGCASGEEAYSLAIAARGVVGPWSGVEVVGLDVVSAALEKARRGRYTRWALREVDENMEARWFRRDGAEHVLSDEIVRAVRFDEHNLASELRETLRGSFDVVFCRNVLMYLLPDVARMVVAGLARALAPGGYLFLGHAETLRGLSTAFHLRSTHETFYYQLRDDGDDLELEPAPPPDAPPVDGGWADAILRASHRVRHLAEVQHAKSDTGDPIDRARDLLREERFAQALAVLHDAPDARASVDPEVLVLRAVLQTHHGDIAAAEQTCADILAVDDLHAGARYVLALCREAEGQLGLAADLDRAAIHLDPTFAMPHLHLGLMARRSGDGDTARRALERAASLLAGEDPARLLLFGGGFGRDALVALCRAELRALEASG